MISRTTRRFWQLFDALPTEVQDQAKAAYAHWRIDPWHSSLRFKKVEDKIPLYSVRVGLGYRAVGKREGDTIKWFSIGSVPSWKTRLRRLIAGKASPPPKSFANWQKSTDLLPTHDPVQALQPRTAPPQALRTPRG